MSPYDAQKDMYRGWLASLQAIRERIAAGGPGFSPSIAQKERAAPSAPPSPEKRTSDDL